MSTRLLAAAVTAALLLLTSSTHAADKKVVRLWQTETESQTMAVLNQIAAEYEKTHLEVSIKVEGLAWGDLEKKLTAALAAGAPPDATHGQPITCVSFAAKGLLRPFASPGSGLAIRDEARRMIACRGEAPHIMPDCNTGPPNPGASSVPCRIPMGSPARHSQTRST